MHNLNITSDTKAMNRTISFPSLLLAIVLLAFSATSPAQEDVATTAVAAPAGNYSFSRNIEMRPSDKRSLNLKAEERNPYARRSSKDEEELDGTENEEELQIRDLLSSLSVSGRSRGKNGLRILFGDIILERGENLPRLIEDQSANLQVVEVSEDAVVLGWLDEETGELTGKTVQIAYDLSPSVTYALHGQPGGSRNSDGAVADRRMGVMRIGQERKKVESELLARDPSKDLPREVYQAGQ